MTWTAYDHTGPNWFCGVYWISGLYKIVFYERISTYGNGRPGYTGYYIRKGEKNWGYHVNPKEPYYDTLEEAQAACSLHWETVKDEPWVKTILRHLETRGNHAIRRTNNGQ